MERECKIEVEWENHMKNWDRRWARKYRKNMKRESRMRKKCNNGTKQENVWWKGHKCHFKLKIPSKFLE